MKKLVVMVMVFVLSLGVLSGCNTTGNNGNNTNSNNATQQSSRTPSETVSLFADLCTARDEKALTDVFVSSGPLEFDDSDSIFVSMAITIQNPSAQMEPEEIEYYQKEYSDLIDTAIVCVKEVDIYTNRKTKEKEEYVQYLDYYLVSTGAHPDWRIVYITTQAGY